MEQVQDFFSNLTPTSGGGIHHRSGNFTAHRSHSPMEMGAGHDWATQW